MKHLFTLLTLLVAGAAQLFAASINDTPIITVKTTKGAMANEKDRTVQFYLKDSIANSDATPSFAIIDWGDSTELDTLVFKKANTLYSTKRNMVSPDQTIKIYGNPTTWFLNMDNDSIYSAEFSDDCPLQEFRFQKDQLTDFSFISKLKKLVYISTSLNPVKTIDVNSNSLQRLNLGTQSNLEKITFTKAPLLYQFDLTKAPIEEVDLSKANNYDSCGDHRAEFNVTYCPNLKKVNFGKAQYLFRVYLSNNSKLENVEYKDMPILDQISMARDSAVTDLKVSNCPMLKQITFTFNNVTSWTVKDLPSLQTLYYNSDTKLDTLTLENLPALKTVYGYRSGLTDLDLTKVGSSVLSNVSVYEGKLKSIKIAPENYATISTMNIYDNAFPLVNIPRRPDKVSSRVNYYAPQAMAPVPTDVQVGDSVDLSGYIYGLDPDSNKVNSTFKITSKFDEDLVEGTDYSLDSLGKLTFLKAFEDSVRIVVVNPAYPEFTDTIIKSSRGDVVHNYALATNYFVINAATAGINSINNDQQAVAIRTDKDRISINGADGQAYSIYDAQGRIVGKGTVNSDNFSVSPGAHGLYIVRVGDKAVKIVR